MSRVNVRGATSRVARGAEPRHGHAVVTPFSVHAVAQQETSLFEQPSFAHVNAHVAPLQWIFPLHAWMPSHVTVVDAISIAFTSPLHA